MNSAKYSFSSADLKKIGKGALIALGGAALAYFAELLPKIEWGSWAPVATALGAVLVNAGMKWIAGQKE